MTGAWSMESTSACPPHLQWGSLPLEGLDFAEGKCLFLFSPSRDGDGLRPSTGSCESGWGGPCSRGAALGAHLHPVHPPCSSVRVVSVHRRTG